MAYHDNLPKEKQDEISEKLLAKVRDEHDAAYQSRLRQAKSKKARDACAGRYEGAWWRLWDGWCQGNISNIHVNDCLIGDCVIGDTEGVKFTPSGKTTSMGKRTKAAA